MKEMRSRYKLFWSVQLNWTGKKITLKTKSKVCYKLVEKFLRSAGKEPVAVTVAQLSELQVQYTEGAGSNIAGSKTKFLCSICTY